MNTHHVSLDFKHKKTSKGRKTFLTFFTSLLLFVFLFTQVGFSQQTDPLDKENKNKEYSKDKDGRHSKDKDGRYSRNKNGKYSKDKTTKFLKGKKGKWTGYAVPYEDGEALYKLIVENNYTSVLEIGTSTGHSAIWLAMAVAQTGGKLTTIEIDEGRYKQALKHFEQAGVSEYVNAILGDANEVIPTLEDNSFDFVFSDATWSAQPGDAYTNFFKLSNPKLKVGGSYTMHNVSDGNGDDGRFFKYLESLGNFETTILKTSKAGISVSVKK